MIKSTIDGRYRIVRLIGIGGMSRVYLGRHKTLDNDWAIKVIDKKMLGSNYLREVNILKNLNHRGIVRIVDIIVDQEYVYLVEDFVDGINLEQLMSRIGTLSQSMVIQIALELIDILKYLHNRPRPVIYGDLKPSNIIIDKDGYLRLVDFGLSSKFRNNKSHREYFGTKGFVSEEDMKQKIYDKKSDIYGLSATMLYLITRNHEYNTNCGINKDLDKIIKKGLDERKNRYSSVDEIELELKKIFDLVNNKDRINHYLNKVGYRCSKKTYCNYETEIL